MDRGRVRLKTTAMFSASSLGQLPRPLFLVNSNCTSKDAVNIFPPNGTRLYILEEMLIRWQVKTDGMDWVRLGYHVNLIYVTLCKIL
jgi:hypothetical protein